MIAGLQYCYYYCLSFNNSHEPLSSFALLLLTKIIIMMQYCIHHFPLKKKSKKIFFVWKGARMEEEFIYMDAHPNLIIRVMFTDIRWEGRKQAVAHCVEKLLMQAKKSPECSQLPSVSTRQKNHPTTTTDWALQRNDNNLLCNDHDNIIIVKPLP